jgi:hypothetical protein
MEPFVDQVENAVCAACFGRLRIASTNAVTLMSTVLADEGYSADPLWTSREGPRAQPRQPGEGGSSCRTWLFFAVPDGLFGFRPFRDRPNTDLVMLARLSQALSRARAVLLAA